jgi:2-polyprenyl-6-hydroxyphenyl methylase/3-demethylubiquinone-9 3-methyltransferase
MADYYSESLYGEKLKRVYDVAPPRVQQYLTAEIQYVLNQIKGMDTVVELGCGYGRVMKPLSSHVSCMVGIDTSGETLARARDYLSGLDCHLFQMDAAKLGFHTNVFDAVICVQNGISAFHVDSTILVKEAVRVTRSGGLVLFSSYSPRFWEHRLQWFRIQAELELIGEIDEQRTGNGIIVCKDGLTLTFVGKSQFRKLFSSKRTYMSVEEVDQSSIFARVEVL